MKKILSILLLVAVLVSCRSSKDYLSRKDEDKALQEAVKKLQKSPDDEKALSAIPVLYNNIKQKHLGNIESLRSSKEITAWDKIIAEYQDLQDAYESIVNNAAAFRLITPDSYAAQILESKDKAAEEYYNAAEKLLDKSTRDDAKKAYSYYKKADKYSPGYKDARSKMQDAMESAIVNVVINPIIDNSFFFNSGFGSYGLNYSNEYFQDALVRELNYENNNSIYAARVYSDWEARRENIRPDWIVDLRLRNMDIPYPQTTRYQRNSSNNILVGKDTSGRPIYQTVYATVYITRSYFNARGEMDVTIRDMQNRGRLISSRSFSETVNWDEETATYSGDRRALSNSDIAILNNSRYRDNYRREDILTELYRKIYPRVKDNITQELRW